MPVSATIQGRENRGSMDASRGTYSVSNPDTQIRISTGLSQVLEFNAQPIGTAAPTDIPTVDLTNAVPGRLDDGRGIVTLITGLDTRGNWEAKGYN